jgi:lipopolysaccharide export system ATP-binding protein
MHTLEVSDLKKSYNGKPVVSDITLSISSGEVVGLLGPNGAGKTTTFYMILGLINPDDGAITLDGENLNSSPMYNIMAVLEITNADKKTKKEKLESILDEFNLSPIAKSQGHHLSGGERRKVEIARALAVDPVFILLDEPFAGIDPIAVNELKGTLKQLTDKGIGLIITDHNVRDTLSITDRAYIISDGHILAHGVPSDLVTNDLVRKSYLGEEFRL